MKGPSSKISKKLSSNQHYGNDESAYMHGKGSLNGKYDVSGSTYVAFQDDTKATLRKMDELRRKIHNLKNG